ncbi:MAG: Toprim subdomain protein [Methanomassiliicoccus sp.]|nr:Toprim subdomain protein [Methanomassiliicoccus sp.]
MRDPKEMLEELEALLLQLKERPEGAVILVEGRKDRQALACLGIGGEIVQVQDARGIFGVAEELAWNGREAIVLTDWDRKGGQLAELLRNALKANGVRYDDSIRARLSLLCKKEIKDIESLPSFMAYLVQTSGAPR